MLETLKEPSVFLTILAVMVLLVISAFFSGSETALTAASRARIHAEERDGNKAAGIVARLLARRERLIGALLLGNNLVNIAASVLMAGVMTKLFGASGMSQFIATLVMTVLILIFAEVLPKTYAITRPDKASLMVSRPVNIIVAIFAPVVFVVQVVVNWFLRRFGIDSDASPWTAADEIRGAVDLHHQEGGVAKSSRDRIIGVLELDELTIEEVMVHRKNIIMVDGGLAPEHILKAVLESGHSRLPVWLNDLDNVIGVLHAKDMLKALSKTDGDVTGLNIRKICRDAWFVPETTSVVKQLRAFQHKREHFAIAVDEYGALMGVITLEDILEEIVGDIQDEYDDELGGVERHSDGSISILGDVSIRDLNRAMDWKLPDEEAVTIAGLVIHESQTIPEESQTFSYYGYRFEILERQRNQIKKLRITKTHQPDQRSD